MAHDRPTVLTAAGAVVALLLTACTAEDDNTPFEDHEPPAHFPQEPLSGLEAFYDQEPDWQDCEDGLFCGVVSVPRSYSDPQGDTIDVEFVADSLDDQPFLVINPGGPGASGIELVAEQANLIFSSRLREEYNIVGFDPRGVSRSEPVECMDDADYDLWNQMTGEAELDGELELSDAELDEIIAQCEQLSGDIIEHIDTISAARDMDILRAALDEDELHYFGMSYGTKLGLAYAELFPDQVGRWALDAVMDVSLSLNGITEDQAAGFERELWDFAQWCADHQDCPIDGGAEDVMEGIGERVDDLWANPVTGSDGRLITANTVFSGLSTTMYLPGGNTVLLEALQQWVEEDDAEYFQLLSDAAAGRNADGSYDWISSWSFRTIMCLDYPEDEESLSSPGLLDDEEAPFTEQFVAPNTEFCDALPGERVGRPWEPSVELPQMLLIGGTQDAATPVEWAENIYSMLPNAALLIYEGDGHISYGPTNSCVTEIVDDYLVAGELFEGREEC